MPGAVGGRVHPFGPVQPSNSGADVAERRWPGRSWVDLGDMLDEAFTAVSSGHDGIYVNGADGETVYDVGP